MPVSSVLCHLSRHVVSGHIVYGISPGLAISALVCLDISFRLPASAISFSWRHLISPLYVSEPSQPLLSEEFRHRVGLHVCLFPHGLVSSFLLPTAACAFQLCATFPLLLLSNCPTICTIHHGRFYSRLVHFVFQLCWYVHVAHHPSSFLPLRPGNLYSVV